MTNPAVGAGALTVTTSSDIVGASTPTYRLVVPSGVATPAVTLSSGVATASQVTYTVGFTTSAQGGLAAGRGSITLFTPPRDHVPRQRPGLLGRRWRHGDDHGHLW